MLSQLDKWPPTFLGLDSWPRLDQSIKDELDMNEEIYISSFISILSLFFNVVRLPIFETPQILNKPIKSKSNNSLQLHLEILKVDFINETIYRSLIKSAARVCNWLLNNQPNNINIQRSFNLIEKSIKFIQPYIPGGKSTIPVLKVAHDLKIPYQHLGMGVYQLGWGSKSRKMDRSTCEDDSAIGSKLSNNKVATSALLKVAGIPSPVHGVVNKLQHAVFLAKKIGYPVVIKPIDGERGEGVTVGVTCDEDVQSAFDLANNMSRSKKVIVERQVKGVCHRIFIANEKLLYAVKRNPMSVIGDGIKNIEELVQEEVEKQSRMPTWKRSEIKLIDELAIITLKQNGKDVNQIPSKNEIISLRPIESTEWGGVDTNVTDIIHEDNLRIALRAAKLFELSVAGIDIISPDISEPWYKNGAIVNEVNFAPLFGGAEISRSYIKKFFTDFMDGDGKIPIIECINEKEATLYQSKENSKGVRCYFTSSHKTIDFLGNQIVMPFNNLSRRVKALTLYSDADLIVFCK